MRIISKHLPWDYHGGPSNGSFVEKHTRVSQKFCDIMVTRGKILGFPDLACQVKLFQPSDYSTVINFWLSHNECFWLILLRYCSVQTHKAENSELDYTAQRSSVQILNHTQSEAMNFVSAHQLPGYYQLYRVSSHLFWSHDIRAAKLYVPKYCQTLDSP